MKYFVAKFIQPPGDGVEELGYVGWCLGIVLGQVIKQILGEDNIRFDIEVPGSSFSPLAEGIHSIEILVAGPLLARLAGWFLLVPYADGIQQFSTNPADLLVGNARDTLEPGEGIRVGDGNVYQGFIADHFEQGTIQGAGFLVSEVTKFMQDSQLPGLKILAAIDPPAVDRFGVIMLSVHMTGPTEIFLSQFPAPVGLQHRFQLVPQGDEVVGIHLGIGQHLSGEGPTPPIGALIFFIDINPKVRFEQGTQPDRLQP